MVLRSGHLFYELRLLAEFSEISFTLIQLLATLETYFVLSTVSPVLTLTWIQKNAPDNVKFGSKYLLLRLLRIEGSSGAH